MQRGVGIAIATGVGSLALQAALQLSGYQNMELAWALVGVAVASFIVAAVLQWRELNRRNRTPGAAPHASAEGHGVAVAAARDATVHVGATAPRQLNATQCLVA
ncbi:MAG: hypothetical protein ACT4O5_18715 [Gammaproteobacteria bacterium]